MRASSSAFCPRQTAERSIGCLLAALFGKLETLDGPMEITLLN
jgi:hypothetical protein